MLERYVSGKRLKSKYSRKNLKETQILAVQALEDFICNKEPLFVLSKRHKVSTKTISEYISRYYGTKPVELNLESKINHE